MTTNNFKRVKHHIDETEERQKRQRGTVANTQMTMPRKREEKKGEGEKGRKKKNCRS